LTCCQNEFKFFGKSDSLDEGDKKAKESKDKGKAMNESEDEVSLFCLTCRMKFNFFGKSDKESKKNKDKGKAMDESEDEDEVSVFDMT
jgi:hypothetical protein